MSSHSSSSNHVVAVPIYLGVFAVLMIGTIVTYVASQIDLEAVFKTHLPVNTIVALTIAVTKATFVVLFFMHVKYSTHLTWAVVAGGMFWFGILIVLTLSDYLTRSWQPFGSV